ncbi:MAG TPA: PD-(D/E)XK nuclease family protein [Candidatus Nitrosocosmicus sp.]|nr:PD-(D/E)XK nuclease family protein [Candidatus Nitrosocosmicus sp.]
MPQDEFSAIWISHSSISDYLKCPRAYYLNNIFKNPKTRRKISLMQPPLALGQIVHNVLDSISKLPAEERFKIPLIDRYEQSWQTVTGKKGGFRNEQEEKVYKERGELMIRRVMNNPGPLLQKTVKIKQELPHYWLSEQDNLILCGRIDWLVYDEKNDCVQILDFKTGRVPEKGASLQLPIYYLLAKNCQSRDVTKACYWYLDRNDDLTEMKMPDPYQAEKVVLDAGRRIKLARQMEHFKCTSGNVEGCIHCAPLEVIVNGRAEFVGINEYNQEVYIMNHKVFDYSLTKE